MKISRNHLLIGGLALAGAALFIHTQKCGLLYRFFSNQCNNVPIGPDPILEDEMPTRPITDDYLQTYNRWINGYREDPTMFPENYYALPFRYPNPKTILTSPGVPDRFGMNEINPDPNAADRWIRQGFSF